LNDTELSSSDKEDKKDYSWLLPVSFKTNLADFPTQTLVLNKSHPLDVEFPGDAAWFKANLNGTGFYRVNYPLENWDALIEALQRDHTQFTPADRAQLINDAFSLSE
jgi:aminopeptidase N